MQSTAIKSKVFISVTVSVSGHELAVTLHGRAFWEQKIRDVAGKPRDAPINCDRYGVCRQLFVSFDTFSWHGRGVLQVGLIPRRPATKKALKGLNLIAYIQVTQSELIL